MTATQSVLFALLLLSQSGGSGEEVWLPSAGPIKGLTVEVIEVQAEDGASRALVRFTNVSDEPFVVLKPLDGSWWGWHRPHYNATLVDASGEPVPLVGRCGISGLWAETEWPKDYAVELAPGASLDVRWEPPEAYSLEPGKYECTFEYRVEKDFYAEHGRDQFPLPPDAWVGVARTVTKTLEIVEEGSSAAPGRAGPARLPGAGHRRIRVLRFAMGRRGDTRHPSVEGPLTPEPPQGNPEGPTAVATGGRHHRRPQPVVGA